MVKVNCAALVETLLLSELFGHEKGSFTGALARRRGRFELAEGGTLFLDEIGDISPRTQVALLRVLQDKTFERVGGVTPIRANVRIVCATHRDLRAMVARGEFREDLYYRLRGFVLEVPALRQRLGDLLSIATAILERIASDRGTSPKRLSATALEALTSYGWPGNIRELENALRAAALFAETDTIELDDFVKNVDGLRHLAPVSGTSLTSSTSSAGAQDDDDDDDDDLALSGGDRRRASLSPSTVMPMSDARVPAPLESGTGRASERGSERGSQPGVAPASRNERDLDQTPTDVAYAHVRAGTSLSDLKRTIERDCIERALAESRGNITRAAALLGMKRPRLSQLVKQYGFGGVSEE
jgi:sigma-54 specific flagellar transcriptional regulator A